MQASADPSTFPSIFNAQSDNQPETAGSAAPAQLSFADLGLPEQLVRVLGRGGITSPFPIQAATVPDALAGRDVLGRGQTGSGKTLAFGLPMLARLVAGRRGAPHRPKGLVLVPTRELATQVAEALDPLAKALGLFVGTAVGGVSYDRQIQQLRRGVDVLVATPGRLGDLIRRRACELDAVVVTVLDEADQMADMGFLPEVTALLALTPTGGQRLLFSATLDGDVDTLVKRFMDNPVTHAVSPVVASVHTMAHHLLVVPPHDKFAITASLAARDGRTIMFVKTQLGVDDLVTKLAQVGVEAGALHGGKTQRVRTRTLAEFREGRTGVLVATDVAARGIHVDGVSLVVHVDPPRDPKDYLHRAGRTARAGAHGTVVTLVLPKQRRSASMMVAKAGVAPEELRVRSGDPALAALTGAREPSGVPVLVRPAAEAPGRRRPAYGDRPAYGGRSAGGDRPTYGSRSAGGDRPAYGGRSAGGDRPAYGGRSAGGDRSEHADRRGHSDRPDRQGQAGHAQVDRPSYGARPAFGARPAQGGRRGPTGARRFAGHGQSPRPAAHS